MSEIGVTCPICRKKVLINSSYIERLEKENEELRGIRIEPNPFKDKLERLSEENERLRCMKYVDNYKALEQERDELKKALELACNNIYFSNTKQFQGDDNYIRITREGRNMFINQAKEELKNESSGNI